MILRKIIHRLLGLRVSETDRTRYTSAHRKSAKLKKARRSKWFFQRIANRVNDIAAED